MTKPAAVVVVASLLALLAVATVKPAERTVGYGQVAYAGLGPERWAQRWRHEHRRARRLTRRLQSYRRAMPRSSALIADFMCIYDGENGGYGWSANTGNGYFGGLQMDLDFQRDWGLEFFRAWGTADHWPAEVQIAVAIRAYLQRGWNPWPNTSRMCGLR
jgi:Transglycosylase-like domain